MRLPRRSAGSDRTGGRREPGRTARVEPVRADGLLDGAALRPGEPIRRQWVPIGLGLLVFALGDVVYGAYELATGAAPASFGLPDLFYAAFYPLVALGIVERHSGTADSSALVRGLAAAGAIGAAFMAVAGIPFLRLAAEAFAADATNAAMRLLFPAADVVFVIVPRFSCCWSLRRCAAHALPSRGSRWPSAASSSRPPTSASCTSRGRAAIEAASSWTQAGCSAQS